MYFKRLTAQATAIAITCASSVVSADANYSHRAKEQAERAAAAAAIAADCRGCPVLSQSRHHRVQKPASHQLNNPAAETSKCVLSHFGSLEDTTDTQTESVRTDAKQSNSGGDGPMEDQPLVIDVSNLYDEDGLGDLTMQWRVRSRVVAGKQSTAQPHNHCPPRQNHVGSSLGVVIQYVDGEGTLEVIETAPTGKVQNSNDLPRGHAIISGSSVEDNTIKIDVSGISDEDGVGQFTYQWERSSDAALDAVPADSSSAAMRLNKQEVGFAYRAIFYVDALEQPKPW